MTSVFLLFFKSLKKKNSNNYLDCSVVHIYRLFTLGTRWNSDISYDICIPGASSLGVICR